MREYLQNGTYIEVAGKIRYKIIGSPIGEGGCSVIYTAKKYIQTAEGVYSESPLDYAIKECFPSATDYNIHRDKTGSIIATDERSAKYLETIKKMQVNEADVSGRIFNVGFRITPVLETYDNISIIDEAGDVYETDNLISVLGSLSEKGQSLKSLISSMGTGKLSAEQAFRITEQLLYSIDEVHKAGYLHLDIQDGNVFLQGSLGSRNHLVSLLDFGTAQKLSEETSSCEVNPGEVYSTQGFTAPEILLCEEEKLRIGYPADIYSIGALTLYLLTGRRSSSKELMNNNGKAYIPRFAIPSTKCPKHLVDKMQAILSKALEVDAEKRYSNAAQMLEDVTDFLEAISPYRNPLTSNTYDAFICYKHNELDNMAAKTLRDSLERFKTKSFDSHRKQQIKSVFLDEGELSSCADFGERINDALRKSEWLIVICSPETKESKWVNEEIRTFLKYHDKSHILAVITDGEPEDVYPQEFKKNGLDATSMFAADARAEGDLAKTKKRIRKDVKLRIAAAILGTTYDALKQRRRQYEMRLVGSYAIVATILLGFAVFKTIQVNTEHKKFLDSQSEYMKEQAFNAYRDNDVVGVLKNAVSAYDFNKESGKNDNTPIQMISEVLNLYKSPNSDETLDPYDTWTPDEDKDNAGLFVVLDSGKYIATADQRSFWDDGHKYRIYIWNADKRKVVTSFDSDVFTKEMFVDGHRCLIADWSKNTISYYDYISKKNEWHCDCENSFAVELSPDGNYLIVKTSDFEWNLYDVKNKNWSQIVDDEGNAEKDFDNQTYYKCQFTRKNDLLITATAGAATLFTSYGYQVNSSFTTKCINPSNNNIKWEYSKDFICQEWGAYAVAVDDYLGIVYGNNIDYLDNESGRLLHHTELPSHIQNIMLDKEHKSFYILLTDGSLCFLKDDGTYSWMNVFPNRTGYCYYGEGCIYTRTMEDDSFSYNPEILIYKVSEGDENYREIDKKKIPEDIIFYDYWGGYNQDYIDSVKKRMHIKEDAEKVGFTSDRKYVVFYYKDYLTVINTNNWKRYDGVYGDKYYSGVSCDQLKMIDDNTLLATGFTPSILSLSGESVKVIYKDKLLDEYRSNNGGYDFDSEYIDYIKEKVGLEGQEEQVAWTSDRKYAMFYYKDNMTLVNTDTWKRIDGDYGAYGYNYVACENLRWINDNTLIGIDYTGTFITVSNDSLSIENGVHLGVDIAYSPRDDSFYCIENENNDYSWTYWFAETNDYGYKNRDDYDGKVYYIHRYTADEIVQMARDRIGEEQ